MPRKKSEKNDHIGKIENETKKNKKNIMNTMIKNNNIDEDKHIILQLPLTETNINNIINDSKNSIEPIPYDNNYYFDINKDNEENNIIENIESRERNIDNYNNKEEIQKTELNIKKTNCCFWCIHPIELDVYGMPVSYNNITNRYTFYGSFCSLQCANAYNFSINSGSHKVWEINSMIQMLGKTYNNILPIRPAPSRYILDIFNGGNISIEEYRKLHLNKDKSHILNLPPMINLTSSYEIINTSYIKSIAEKNLIITNQLNQIKN